MSLINWVSSIFSHRWASFGAKLFFLTQMRLINCILSVFCHRWASSSTILLFFFIDEPHLLWNIIFSHRWAPTCQQMCERTTPISLFTEKEHNIYPSLKTYKQWHINASSNLSIEAYSWKRLGVKTCKVIDLSFFCVRHKAL